MRGLRLPERAPLPGWWWRLDIGRRRVIAGITAAVLGVAALLGLVVLFGGTTSDAADAYVAQLSPEQRQTWNSLAECESRQEWDLDTGNGFYGGLQFSLQSWEGVGGTGLPSDASKNEQIMRAQMLQDLQGYQAWPDCAAELGLT